MARIEPIHCTLKNGERVVIRTAEENDVAALAACHLDVRTTSEHTVTQPDEARRDEAEERAWIRKHLDSPIGLLLLAEPADRPGVALGSIVFKPNERRRMAHHGHFGLGIVSTHRGVGLGRLMLQAVVDWARAHPTIEKVCLGCFADNHRALALYRSMGFVEEGRRLGEFRLEDGTLKDDVQMMLWVKDPRSRRGLSVGEWVERFGPRTQRPLSAGEGVVRAGADRARSDVRRGDA